MFTRTFEYALRCVLFLARNNNSVPSIRRIAAETEIPRDYLYKLVPALHRPGLVAARRGKLGGLRLLREPAAITIFDVLTAVEPWSRLDGCPLSTRGHCVSTGPRGTLCGLHAALDQVADAVERRLKSITLADFLREGTVSVYPAGANFPGRAAPLGKERPRRRKRSLPGR